MIKKKRIIVFSFELNKKIQREIFPSGQKKPNNNNLFFNNF